MARIAGEAGAKGIVVAGSMLRNKRDKADGWYVVSRGQSPGSRPGNRSLVTLHRGATSGGRCCGMVLAGDNSANNPREQAGATEVAPLSDGAWCVKRSPIVQQCAIDLIAPSGEVQYTRHLCFDRLCSGPAGAPGRTGRSARLVVGLARRVDATRRCLACGSRKQGARFLALARRQHEHQRERLPARGFRRAHTVFRQFIGERRSPARRRTTRAARHAAMHRHARAGTARHDRPADGSRRSPAAKNNASSSAAVSIAAMRSQPLPRSRSGALRSANGLAVAAATLSPPVSPST